MTTPAVPTWTLGDRLRKAREHAAFSQLQLADATGIARNSIARYEGDLTQPRRYVLDAIARATGVDAEWLADGLRARRDSNPQPSDP